MFTEENLQNIVKHKEEKLNHSSSHHPETAGLILWSETGFLNLFIFFPFFFILEESSRSVSPQFMVALFLKTGSL